MAKETKKEGDSPENNEPEDGLSAAMKSFLVSGMLEEGKEDEGFTPPTEEELERRLRLDGKDAASIAVMDPEERAKLKKKDEDEQDEEDEEDEKEKGEKKEERKPEPKSKITVRKAEPPPPPPAPPPPKAEPEPKEPEPEPDPYEISEQDRALLDELPSEISELAYDALATWKAAEEIDPDKYKGKFSEWLSFYKADAAKRRELGDTDPDADPEEDPAYIRWRERTRPKALTRAEARKLEREIIAHEAEKKVAVKFESKTKELEEWKRKKELEEVVSPKINQAVQTFATDLIEKAEAVEEIGDLVQTMKAAGYGEAGLVAVAEEHGEEYAEILRQYPAAGTEIVRTIVALRSGLEPLDDKNQTHIAAYNNFVRWEDGIAEDPKRRVRDGKEFLNWRDYNKLPAAERAKHWTLDETMIAQMMRHEVLYHVTEQIKAHRQKEEAILQRYAKKKGITLEQAKKEKTQPPPVKGGAPDNKGDDPPSPRHRQTRMGGPLKPAEGTGVSKFLMTGEL